MYHSRRSALLKMVAWASWPFSIFLRWLGSDMMRFFFVMLLASQSAVALEILDLEGALTKALVNHPMIMAAKANYDAEKSSIRSQQWLSDPMMGVMYEKNMSLMQQQMGPMTTLFFSQDIQFPAKYYYRGQIQQNRASFAKENLGQTQLSLRRQVITSYFNLYSNQQIKALLEAQQDALREVARIAESRHAIGAVSQQDEMKAHVEQTLVENEHLVILQEERALRARLVSLLGDSLDDNFSIPPDNAFPKANLPPNISEVLYGNSRRLKQNNILINETTLQKRLALFNYAPDFRLGAKTMVGANRPDNNFGIFVEFSLPLWFFMRQTSEVSAASARAREATRNLESTKRE